MTDLDIATKLAIPKQVVSRAVGDETVLLDLESGIYFGLDGVGQRIWEALGEGKTLGEVTEIVVQEYEVDVGRAKADVLAFVGELVERGLVEVGGA